VADSRQPTDRDLPFVIELWHQDGALERVLARAATAPLAQVILARAKDEYPGRQITLREDNV
jgi:hypothetical protein